MNAKIPLVDISESTADAPEIKELYESRKKIYVREISGYFQRIRRVTLSLLLLMYFSFCWITVDGRQLVLFDIQERKFHLFGATFWPQDFALLAMALIISAFGLFFVTSLFGRVWCGYSCPQTAWSLMFIWLEERFEGSRLQRIKLDKAPLGMNKLLRKTGKHSSWLLISLATAVTFVGYFYPIRELMPDLFTGSISSGWAIFWICFFTLATYANAGWLREQVCIYMCPYARFQSVMFNKNTQIVGYDQSRGEPRGNRSRISAKKAEPVNLQPARSQDKQLGDCVDCQMCVQVCPTGIDIRDGLQYECIGCALCIDACDSIMEKMDYAPGLIRYASETEFEKGRPEKKFDARAKGYALVLALSLVCFSWMMMQRPMIEFSVSRDRGGLYQLNSMGFVENYYTLKIANKQESERYLALNLGDFNGTWSSAALKDRSSQFRIGPGELLTLPVTLTMNPDDIKSNHTDVEFTITTPKQQTVEASALSRFLGPVNLPY